MSTDPENSKVAGESVSALEDNEMSNTTDPNVVPPFINSWAPLPSSAPATSAIGMNASLNLNMNLVSFYGNGSSVISGPPLLGGVLSNSNNGGNPPSLHSEYYSFPVPGNSNNQTMGSSGKASAGTSAGMNIPGPAEGLQRAHSNSFNGFTYNQGQPFNNNAGSLNTSQSGQPGGMGGNHIDFMNINSSPPLLSNASATSPGLYLSNMSNKGDNMNMMNHSNMFSNMHGILPTASGSYSNLINLNGVGNSNVNSSNNNSNSNNNNDGIASQQNTVGVKRLPVSTLSATTAAAVVAANKKAKANANAARARAASCSTAPDVPGQQNGAVSNTGGVATATTVNASRTTAPTVASAAGPQPASKVVTSSLQVSNAASSSVLSTTQSLPRTGGTGVGPTVARGGVGAQSGTQPSNAYFSANAPPSSMPQPSAANASSGPGAGVGVQPVGLNAAPQQPQQHQGALQHTHYPQQHPTQQQHMQSAAYATSTDRLSAVAAASGYYGAPPTDTRTTGTNAGYAHTQSGMHSSIQAQQAPQQLQHGMHPPQSFGGMTQPAGVQQGGLAQAGIHQLSQHSHLQNPSGLYVPGSTSQGIGSRTIGYIPQSTSSNNGGGGGGECTVAYSNPAQQQQQQQGYAGVGTSTYSMQMQSGYHPGSSAGGAGNSGSYPQVPYHHGNQGQQQHAQAQQQAPHVPIYTPGVVPPNKTGVGAAPAKQARARATKPAKVVKKAPAVGGGNGLGGVHDGTDPGISGVGQDGATADGTTAVPARALTYKEKRAMSSKKALAAAAAAEAQRSGELPLSHRTDTDSKRRDSKKDKDGNTADGDKEKAEKEESLATLLRRREPIASRLEDMEDSKFLGRKGPVPPTPDLLPVPPAGAAPVFGGVVTTGTGGPLCTGSRRKTHWDYLLEEVQWMALDFRQELRWKMGAAKHTALACASLSSQCMVPRKLADSAAVTSVSSEVTSVSVAVPVRRSAADAQAARAVAGTLSRSVQSYWTALEEKVTSLSHQGANLRDFLRRVANQDITATDFFESSHGDDEDDEDEAEESSLNATCEPAAVPLDKVIDTILSVPALVAASPEVPKVEMCSSTITIASEKARTSHRKTRSPSSAREEPVTPAVSIVGADSGALPLQAHQRAAVSQVESLNNLNFGAMVCGRAYIGKTVACCSLIGQWLSASQSPAAVVSVVLLVGPRASEARWTAELLTVQFHGEIVVWDESVPSCVTSSVKAENASAGRILYVPDDVIAAFIKSPDFEALLAPTEVSSADPSLSSTCSLQGIFVDLRRMRCGSLQEDKQAVKHVQTSSSSSSCSLSLLSARVPATLTRRCVIREDSHSLENALETLCFLCPSTALPSWQAKFPTEAGAVSKKGAVRKGESGVSDAHLQQINRNTVTQLLVNLSVIVKLPSNADSVVAAQTRMETIAAEMDPTQARSYSLLMMCILRHSSICSGESTDQLAQALLLLRKVCFHASLLCHTGRNSAPPPRCGAPSGANKYITSTSPITVDGGYYAGGLVNPVLRPATHPGGSSSGGSSSSSGELYWPLTADRPATQWRPAGPGLYAGGGAINPSGDYVQHLSGGFTATPLGDIAFAQGPIAAPPSRFRDTPTQERLELGSCKLVCLRRLVWRFAGLKVAVVVETAEECALVQQLLVLLNVKFDTAFHCDYLDDVVDCTINPTDDSLIGGVCKATRWVDAQNSVQSFNSPQNSSSFLLCSKHVFQSPNIPPHQADAVVILSDDWVSTTDVKDCFRLRLLSAGPTGPPLTVVRVVAAASIEERMVRKGTSFLQLQGTPLAQLRTGFLSHPPATAVTAAAPGSDLAKDSQHVGGGDAAEEFTLLCKAPTLFAPSIPRTSSSSASASTSLTSPQHDAGHSVPTKEPSQSALTKGNEGEQGGRGKGKGKGFIMVGKQGATTLVKEQDAAHSMVLFRGARGTNGDLLRHPDTLAWIQRLRRDMQVAEREFKRRDRSVSFQRSRNVSQTHTLQVPFLSHRPVSPLAEHNAMEVVVSGEENVDLKFTTPNTRSDATICSAFLEINYILGRMVLNSVPSDQRANHLHRCPTGVLKILESRWVDAIANLQEATHRKLCDEDEENDNEFAVVTPDSAVCPPLSEWQIRRLHASGLGMNAAENMLSALVLPYRANGTMPQESSAPIKMKTEAENTAAPSSSSFWPQSFFVFRDVLAETRRQGIHLEATLHVNPLQSACRNDTITAAAHNRAHLGEEDSMCIKYVVDGGKGSAGTSRSSKSRRSRPSASRKKDPSGAAANNNNNGASAADGSSAAQEADDGTAEGGAMQSQLGQDFEVGFLSDLDPMGDSPQKSSQQAAMVSPRYATAPPPAVAIPANSPNKSQKVFAQQSPAMQAPYNATVVGTGASPSTLTAQYSVVAANVAIAPAAPAPIPAPVGRPVHVQESNYDSWHPTEDDIIICTQNAFSDPHFKRTENWLNKAQEQANNSRKRARTATEARLRYTWLCTTGRTQQRLQDPQVIAQIAHLKSFLSARQASATANAGVGASAGAGVGASAGAAYSNPGHPGVAGQAGTNVSNVSSPTLAHQQDNSPASNANS